MNPLYAIIDWLAGNGKYMKLTHCMGGDTFWIYTTVTLDLANAAGYVLIATHWWRNARHLPKIPAKEILGNMRNIFIFCGICGYLFIPIKMVWPGWRLYDIVLAVLVFYTWRYALRARDLKVVYSAIGQSNQLQVELEQSKAESKRKSLFFNAISHDLRTPLNGLVLQADLAEMSLQDPETLAAALVEIRAGAAATASLLDTLLDFARQDWSETGNQTATFDLRSVVQQTIASAKASADVKGLTLTGNCPAGINISTDRIKLERILGNLVTNAVKFTQQGSVRVQVEAAGKGVEIHVIDTGVGIAMENQVNLFQDFYQINNHERDRKKGFGLGLSISRRLARQLGGDVVVESGTGTGSRFSILLPSCMEQQPASAQPAGEVVVVTG